MPHLATGVYVGDGFQSLDPTDHTPIALDPVDDPIDAQPEGPCVRVHVVTVGEDDLVVTLTGAPISGSMNSMEPIIPITPP